ncbi:hypothetical protein X975_09726, partial [Stegodyphus mimosarum]
MHTRVLPLFLFFRGIQLLVKEQQCSCCSETLNKRHTTRVYKNGDVLYSHQL